MKPETRQAPSPVAQSTQVFVNQPKTSAILAGWVILLFGFILALVPGLGLSMMLISFPVCIAGFILGLIGAANSKPFHGVFLIISSIVSFPIFWIIPWFSALLGFGGVHPHEVDKPISQPISQPIAPLTTKPHTPPITKPVTPPITKPQAEKIQLPVEPRIDEIRTWTDASGGFKTKATYNGIAGGKVSLLKTTGETITIPFERLSADDQKWVKAVEGVP
jgi:hypothetical protein